MHTETQKVVQTAQKKKKSSDVVSSEILWEFLILNKLLWNSQLDYLREKGEAHLA